MSYNNNSNKNNNSDNNNNSNSNNNDNNSIFFLGSYSCFERNYPRCFSC